MSKEAIALARELDIPQIPSKQAQHKAAALLRSQVAELEALKSRLATAEAERDAALAREAAIDFSILYDYSKNNRVNYNQLCAIVKSALITRPVKDVS
jgi:hypothetical protein